MTSTLIFRCPFINKPVAEHKCCINQAICEFLSIFIDLTNISNKIFCEQTICYLIDNYSGMPLSYVYWTEEMISDMKDRGYTLEEINAMSI